MAIPAYPEFVSYTSCTSLNDGTASFVLAEPSQYPLIRHSSTNSTDQTIPDAVIDRRVQKLTEEGCSWRSAPPKLDRLPHARALGLRPYATSSAGVDVSRWRFSTTAVGRLRHPFKWEWLLPFSVLGTAVWLRWLAPWSRKRSRSLSAIEQTTHTSAGTAIQIAPHQRLWIAFKAGFATDDNTPYECSKWTMAGLFFTVLAEHKPGLVEHWPSIIAFVSSHQPPADQSSLYISEV